ncbi:MAG TPA: hypothetical protein VGJ81_06045 [Thermoanaerobaculia bacterium]
MVRGVSVLGVDDKRIAEWLFLLTFFAAAYFYAGAGWNQNATFDLTRALVERHTFAIDAYAGNTGDVSYGNGHVYANKAPALSFLAAVPYFFVHTFGIRNLAIACYFCTLFTCGIFAALVPALLYRIGRRRGLDPLWSATVALIVAFGTELFPYSTVLMVMVPAGSLMLIAYTVRRAWVAGLAAALATAMYYICAPAMVVIALIRGRKTLVPFIAGALPPLFGLAAYQYLCFGGLLTSSMAKTDPRFITKGGALFGLPSLDALYGITISPYRGLLFFAPVLVMAIAPVLRTLGIVVISGIFLIFNLCYISWDAGFGVGARYLVPLIPLWGIALLRVDKQRLVIALGVLSIAINFGVTAVDPQPSATIPRPLTQYILPLLLRGNFSPDVPITAPWSAATFTGHTSVNRLAHDEAIVFRRHAPGSLDSEWSSFNLGELIFGPGDARSLIPFGAVFLAAVAAILWKARRLSRASAARATR